jgi:CubicO group peptidase (beta-lactamase class C family)
LFKNGTWQVIKKYFAVIKNLVFVLIKHDSVIHEQYWDGCDENSHTNSFSMAKTITSILIGCAIDDGKIKNVDEPVSDFLPEYNNAESSKLTIKNLLTMSSGINFDEDYVSPFAYPGAAYYGSDIKKLTYKYKVTGEPGKTFCYLSGNTELLGFILEKATGKSVSDYASEKLWKPLGAKNSAYWSLDHKDGMEKTDCCFNSDAPDFARIGQLFLDSGKWNGTQIISKEYVLNSIKPADLIDDFGKKNQKYGYSWWIIPNYKGHDIFYARGLLAQYILCIPDKKMVIVRLGNKKEKILPGQDHSIDVFYYIDAALEMYGGK